MAETVASRLDANYDDKRVFIFVDHNDIGL